MKKENKLLRSQKGSISMFVIVSVLFLTFVLMGIYASYANKLKAQEEQLGKIQENYEKYASEDGMDQIYASRIEPAIGDYVKYEVSYIDTFTNYEFTANDGWRILDLGTPNGDRTYSNVKLISTGLPARLYYSIASNIGNENNGWWGTEEQVKEVFGEEYVSAGYGSSGYPNHYAAVGLLKNFESIPLTAGTSAPANQGFFTKINSIVSGSTTGAIFKAKGAAEVHNLTLEEVNNLRGLPVDDTTTLVSTTDPALGLFYLRNLANENSKYGYTSTTGCRYWLAYPVTEGSTYRSDLRSINPKGEISIGANADTRSVRPVVTLSSNIKWDSKENIWAIVE